MSLISTGFLLFLLVGLIIYYIIPKRFQWAWLLILSYAYYLCSGYKSVIFIITTTLITYVGGRILSKEENKLKTALEGVEKENKEAKKQLKEASKKRKKQVVALIIILDFGILAVLKYYGFFIDNINSIAASFNGGSKPISTFELLLPLGISFYTFQSVGYIIDVYRGKYEACANVFKFALFVSYFPQIMQGPIGRYDRLAPQLFEPHYYDLTKIELGAQLMAWGFFKKFVIADRVAVVANTVFQHPGEYKGFYVLAGVLAYCLQLYGDFSGGIDLVAGASEMYGIKLDENFRQPFFAKSIGEFWRRWHITLGTWMKDYVFYSFSLSKGMTKLTKKLKDAAKKAGENGKNTKIRLHLVKALPICLADLLIFFIVGVWHGAAWKFIVYGMYNGIIIAASALLAPVYEKMFAITHINKNAKWYKLFQIVRTFILVNIGWYFDNANNLKDAFILMGNTLQFSKVTWIEFLYFTKLQYIDFYSFYVGIAAIFVVSVLKEKGINIRESLAKKPLVIRWAVYIALVMSIPVFGYVDDVTGGFMYAKF